MSKTEVLETEKLGRSLGRVKVKRDIQRPGVRRITNIFYIEEKKKGYMEYQNIIVIKFTFCLHTKVSLRPEKKTY